ncbi:rod shape-determining protein MreC [Pseudodesulfovibrio pelocollis]|uniref:rod shape-determining protein MreC n=1 Tax=Pseudodesulfovibrio pelocollis TaxID=3051432 RepID=UPI00255AC914|nr:rod shape-determining protein MreC [Pseudodesulfovibrio sp. SB368]
MKKPKKIAIVIVAGLFVYLSLYTWNLRTGHLDALSSHTGLDIASLVIRPGQWVLEKATDFWERYIHLVGLKQQNDDLARENARLVRKNMILAAEARSAERLERLLGFTPPDHWEFSGARVVAHRMGPTGSLATLAVDRGGASGVSADMPVVSLDGVVGRVLRAGAVASTVLLLTDANSRIAIIGEHNRTPGMLAGQGYGEPLTVHFMNLNAVIDPGELLLTSGLSGIFPKGLPVARVVRVRRSDISLFLTVEAEPLVDVAGLEEVLLLHQAPEAPDGPEAAQTKEPGPKPAHAPGTTAREEAAGVPEH